MAYDETLAARVREVLTNTPNVEEKKMFKGITFMVNDKMCVSVSGNELMCRIAPELSAAVIEQPGCRPMIQKGKTMKGYIYIDPEFLKTPQQLQHWINAALEFNSKAKSSKK